VTFFGLDDATYEDNLHQAGSIASPRTVECVIDLTPVDGSMGNVCMDRGIPYLAIALTEFHRSCLSQRLAQGVFKAFLSPKSPLHVPALCELFNKGDAESLATKLSEEVKNKQKVVTDGATGKPGGGADVGEDGGGKKKEEEGEKKKATLKGKGENKGDGSSKTTASARDRLLARLQTAAVGDKEGDTAPEEPEE
jgi:hypothetical protein